jgi:hypothetical protein
MSTRRHYAYKKMLPKLWQAVFYLLAALGACALIIGDNSWLDKGLTAVLVVFASANAYVQGRRFLKTYYIVGRDIVTFVDNGMETRRRFSDLDNVQYDSAHMGIQMVFVSGFAEMHSEYNDFTPLINALDAYGVRIEYKKMGKDPAREMGGPTISRKSGEHIDD